MSAPDFISDDEMSASLGGESTTPDFISDDDMSAHLTGTSPMATEDRSQYAWLPEGTEPDLIDKARSYALGLEKGAYSGAARIATGPADFIVHQGNRAANALTGNDVDLKGLYPSDWVNNYLDLTMGRGGNKTARTVGDIGGTVASTIAMPALSPRIAANIPLLSKAAETSKLANLAAKTIGYGTEGGLYGLFSNPKSEDPLWEAEKGAALNIGVAGATHLAGKGINYLAEKFPGLARTLDRKSLTARASDYGTKSNTTTIETPEGGVETFVKSKLDDLLGSGELGASRNPATLAKVVDTKTSALNEAINSKISEYDKAVELGLAPAAAPEFKATEQFLAKGKAPASEIDSYMAEVSDLNNAINEKGEGFLSYLQEQKKSFSSKWKSASAAKDPKAKFYRAIYDDLKTSVEKYVPEVKGLNQELQKYMIVDPIVNRALIAQESANPIEKAIRFGYTTGGATGGALLGSLLGGPAGAVIGTGLGIGARALSTPRGLALAAKGLRGASGPASTIASLFTKSADPLGRLAASQLLSDRSSPAPSTYSDLFTRPQMEDKKTDIAAIESLIDQDPIDKTIYEFESNRNPLAKNPKSTASGGFQLLKGTAKKLGVKDVFDLADNYTGYKKLRAENARYTGDNVEDVYAAHYLGLPVYRKMKQGKPLNEAEQAQVDDLVNVLLPRLRTMYRKNTGVESV